MIVRLEFYASQRIETIYLAAFLLLDSACSFLNDLGNTLSIFLNAVFSVAAIECSVSGVPFFIKRVFHTRLTMSTTCIGPAKHIRRLTKSIRFPSSTFPQPLS